MSSEKSSEEGAPRAPERARPRVKSRLVVAPAYGSAIASELMRAIAEAQGSGDMVWGPDDVNGGGGFSRG